MAIKSVLSIWMLIFVIAISLASANEKYKDHGGRSDIAQNSRRKGDRRILIGSRCYSRVQAGKKAITFKTENECLKVAAKKRKRRTPKNDRQKLARSSRYTGLIKQQPESSTIIYYYANTTREICHPMNEEYFRKEYSEYPYWPTKKKCYEENAEAYFFSNRVKKCDKRQLKLLKEDKIKFYTHKKDCEKAHAPKYHNDRKRGLNGKTTHSTKADSKKKNVKSFSDRKLSKKSSKIRGIMRQTRSLKIFKKIAKRAASQEGRDANFYEVERQKVCQFKGQDHLCLSQDDLITKIENTVLGNVLGLVDFQKAVKLYGKFAGQYTLADMLELYNKVVYELRNANDATFVTPCLVLMAEAFHNNDTCDFLLQQFPVKQGFFSDITTSCNEIDGYFDPSEIRRDSGQSEESGELDLDKNGEDGEDHEKDED